ncbi:hypothetical protein [Spirosoma endophyticum]|uniref:Uncharacterized protein n=1 Tax=Spirosoma endophyticum TaxID=662367 RepID=A0A1I2DGK7_9BACT|nr:hypothetical protein [Spirosoma endophyticum]SFE79666.1 hypothetical protein SAMN05216167_119124 [Spirosoma endophyticum]
MKTVWLTKEQLEDARCRVENFPTDLLQVEVRVKPFQAVLFSNHIYPEYQALTLRFRRTAYREVDPEKGHVIQHGQK